MDVVNVEQAKIAEEAGVKTICSFRQIDISFRTFGNSLKRFQACAVMALERVPADIRKDGGVSRMSDPKVISRSMTIQY